MYDLVLKTLVHLIEHLGCHRAGPRRRAGRSRPSRPRGGDAGAVASGDDLVVFENKGRLRYFQVYCAGMNAMLFQLFLNGGDLILMTYLFIPDLYTL